MRPGKSSSDTLSSDDAARASAIAWFAALRACAPVSASMRRTPAATPASDTPEMTPMSPVRRTCVPPHSSTDQPSELPGLQAPRPSPRREPRRRISRRTARARRRPAHRRAPSAASSPANSAARNRWRGPRPSPTPPPSSAWDARSRTAAGRARPASPSARRDRRAPGAAPRAGDASPNGCARIALRREPIHLKRQRLRPTLRRALLDRADVDKQVAGLLLRVGHLEAHAVGAPSRRCRRPGRPTPHRTASG